MQFFNAAQFLNRHFKSKALFSEIFPKKEFT